MEREEWNTFFFIMPYLGLKKGVSLISNCYRGTRIPKTQKDLAHARIRHGRKSDEV